MKQIKTNDLSALGALLVRKGRMSGNESNVQNLPRKPYSPDPNRTPIAFGTVIPPDAPIPIVERRKREENNNRIKKLASIIKRQDPRLYTEALQSFGHDLEGLNTEKQQVFIKTLEGIRKEYRI